MTKLDQLRLEVRRGTASNAALAKRMAAVEAILAARPVRRKRERARPSDASVTGRNTLWARLVLLHAQFGHGRLTKLKFVVKYHLGDPSDFCRFLSAGGARGIAEGSVPAVRYYRALKEAIAELEARKAATQVTGLARAGDSHGNRAGSQFSAARPQ